MHKVVDERLKIQLLKNFKIAFLIENAVIILVLIYQSFKNIDQAISMSNPLFAVFMAGTMALSFISVNVSATMADKPKRSNLKLLIYFLPISIVVSLFFIITIPRYILFDILCGIICAALATGLLIYANHYRYRDN